MGGSPEERIEFLGFHATRWDTFFDESTRPPVKHKHFASKPESHHTIHSVVFAISMRSRPSAFAR